MTDPGESDRRPGDAERVLGEAFEQARDGIMLVDPVEESIRRVNPAACDMLGYDRETLLGTSPGAIHPEEMDEFRAFVRRVREEGVGRTDELTCRTSSGRDIPAEISASAVELDGRPHVLAIVRDVSERRAYERRLAELNAMTRELVTLDDEEAIARRVVSVAERVLDQPLTAIWSYAPGSNRLEPLAATAVAEEFSESNTEAGGIAEIHDGTFEMEVFEGDEPVEVENYGALSNAAHPETPLGTVLMVPIGDHGVLHVGSRAVEPFGESARHLVEILARSAETAFDRADHQRALERKNQRLEEFATIVSHDLRNPLEIAQGYVDPARETGDQRYFDEIADALDHMEQLIDDVLTLTRQGESVGDPELANLSDVVARAWEYTATDEAQLTLRDDLGTVECDGTQVQQLFQNLFANAVDHAGPDVAITVGRLDEGFYVADDGPGIPPAERDDVFDAGHSNDPDGTGFGLAIASRIASAHGWELRVTESDAGGARFEVTGCRIRH